MANNFLQFSFMIEEATQEEADFIQGKIRNSNKDGEDYVDLVCEYVEGGLYLYCNESGDIERTCVILMESIKIFRPAQVIFFEWADWCSKPRVGEFSGGAAIVSKDGWASFTTQHLVHDLERSMKAGDINEQS